MEQIKKKIVPQLTVAKANAIKDAAGGKCERCTDIARQVHHIKPRENGGENWESNLIALCANCHDDYHHGKIKGSEFEDIVKKRSDDHKYQITFVLKNVRPSKSNDFQNTNSSINRNDSVNRNVSVPESNGVHPKINTIKMQVCKGLLEGKSVIQLSKIIYPDREQGRSTYHLMYRQVQEVEKDGLIRVVQRPTSESDYIDIKIEEITDGVFGLKKANKVVTSKKRNGNTREQVISAVCDEGLTFEQAAIKYDHQGDGERDGSQKVGNLVKRHIKLAIGEGTIIDNGNDTYSRT